MKIVKRDGRKVQFNPTKISDAVKGAAKEAKCSLPDSQFLLITQQVLKMIEDKLEAENTNEITVEAVQDIVEKVLGKAPFKSYKGLKDAYAGYRKERTQVREFKSELMKTITKIGIDAEKEDHNNNYTAKLLRIASEANKWHNLANMPKNLAKAHENGELYYHALDSYNLTINSLQIATGYILSKGFDTGNGVIRPPQRIETASDLSCVLLQSAQNDLYGSQSHVDFDNDLGIFVRMTRTDIEKELISYGLTGEVLKEAVNKKLRNSVRQAMQAVVYKLNTLHSRGGNKASLSSINIGIPKNDDAALVCELLLSEYEKGLGFSEQPVFPNIIFRIKSGVNANESDPYNYLFKLACRVAAKRLNPTFMNLDADFNKEYYNSGCIPATTGCRNYLMKNINGECGPNGRGNIATVTINLPKIALLSNSDEDKFFELLSERLETSRESLMHRYSFLKKLKVKDIPFVAGENLIRGSENLNRDDSIEPILKQGSYAIGFVGLAEALVFLTGGHHGQSDEAKSLGEKIVKQIRKYTDSLTKKTKLNWVCYATPSNDVAKRFIEQDKKVFGEICGVTDREEYTNSFHVPKDSILSYKEKLDIESPYHKLCDGGHMSYVELDDCPTGEDIEEILKYVTNSTNIGYVGISFNMTYCRDCGSYAKGEVMLCPNCMSENLEMISRVDGYLNLDKK